MHFTLFFPAASSDYRRMHVVCWSSTVWQTLLMVCNLAVRSECFLRCISKCSKCSFSIGLKSAPGLGAQLRSTGVEGGSVMRNRQLETDINSKHHQWTHIVFICKVGEFKRCQDTYQFNIRLVLRILLPGILFNPLQLASAGSLHLQGFHLLRYWVCRCMAPSGP